MIAFVRRLVGRCAHHFVVKGNGAGWLYLECLHCGRRSTGWIVHPAPAWHDMARHGVPSLESKEVRT